MNKGDLKMSLNGTISNGKIEVTINREEEIDKLFKLKQSTIDRLDEMSADWNVTNSAAVDFIVKTFYELYEKTTADNVISQRELQQQQKEDRIKKTIELRNLNIYTKAELAEKVGVSKSTMDTYIREINKRNTL